jgi:hypothetical protein
MPVSERITNVLALPSLTGAVAAAAERQYHCFPEAALGPAGTKREVLLMDCGGKSGAVMGQNSLLNRRGPSEAA